jgi:hypothetical protein
MPDFLLQENMEHGSKNEINAAATPVEKVIPSYFPNICHEEVCKTLVGEKQVLCLSQVQMDQVEQMKTQKHALLLSQCLVEMR